MTSPPPYVLPSEWTVVVLKGGKPNSKVSEVSLVVARSHRQSETVEEHEVDDAQTKVDPNRNELVVAAALRAHLLRTSKVTSSSTAAAVSTCRIKDWTPKKAMFNAEGRAEIKVLLEGQGGPFEVCGKDDAHRESHSDAFAVTKRQLMVSTSVEDWEQQLEGSDEWPKSWLKDMGKKDKTLSFSVSVNSTLPAGSHVPLRASLVYSDGLVVPNQKLLTIKTGALELTDKRPSCIVFFRVEDVSKNHQSKAFMVLIEPVLVASSSSSSSSAASAADPSFAPCCGYPVIVKSKINKKRKSNRGAAGDDDGLAEPRSSKHSADEGAAVVELVTALSASLSESLIKNSQDRTSVELQLNDLFARTRELHDQTSAALERMNELSKERSALEAKFADLISKCNVVNAPEAAANDPETQPGATFPASATTTTGATGFTRSLSLQQDVFGSSTASALIFGGGGGNGGSIGGGYDVMAPSGLLRLSTGDLSFMALNVTQPTMSHQHSLSSTAMNLSSKKARVQHQQQEEDGEEDDDDNEDNNNDDSHDKDDGNNSSSAPLCTFVSKSPVEMVLSNEKRWLAFSDSHALVGYFLQDGSFVDISSVRDAKWIAKQQGDESRRSLEKLERLDTSDAGKLLDQVLDVIRR